VGPVVVPNERDYAAAKDAEGGSIGHRARSIAHRVGKRKAEGESGRRNFKAKGKAHRVEQRLLLEEIIKKTERSDINKYSIFNFQYSFPACPG
jgi:hypothetical protein